MSTGGADNAVFLWRYHAEGGAESVGYDSEEAMVTNGSLYLYFYVIIGFHIIGINCTATMLLNSAAVIKKKSTR